MRQILVCLTSLGILVCTSLLLAAEPPVIQFHVSAQGSDKNSGLAEKESFQTVAHALKVLSTQPGEKPALYEIMVSGNVTLSETLKLNEKTLPKNATGLTIRGVGPNATLSGGQKITGWQRDGKLWRTKIPEVADGSWKFRELFVNGERRPRARTPNEGYNRIEKAGPDNRTSLYAARGDLPNA